MLFLYSSALSNASYDMTWNELREMKEAGLFDVQSHIFWHPNFKIGIAEEGIKGGK